MFLLLLTTRESSAPAKAVEAKATPALRPHRHARGMKLPPPPPFKGKAGGGKGGSQGGLEEAKDSDGCAAFSFQFSKGASSRRRTNSGVDRQAAWMGKRGNFLQSKALCV